MARFAIFEKLSADLSPDLAAGHYAFMDTSAGSSGQPRPAGDTLWIDTQTGIVHAPDGRSADLLHGLGYNLSADDLAEPKTLAFRIGVPGLFARAVTAALTKDASQVVDDDGLQFAALTLAEVIAVLVEALAILGRINARRPIETILGDTYTGIDAVILGIRIVAPSSDKDA